MLVPGAAHATKRWPVRHWRRLASELVRRGWRVALIGGGGDRVIAAEIATVAGRRAASAAGELDLQASGALLRRAAVAIAGDTGPMHLATAVGTPVVALFGPTVEQFGFFPYRGSRRGPGARPALPPLQQQGGATLPARRSPLPRGYHAGPGTRPRAGAGPVTEGSGAQAALVDLLPRAARGPRRDGVFALWLTLRVAEDQLIEPPLTERAARRRLQALEHRLSSLTLPPPLRRALTAALHELRTAGPAGVPLLLASLVAPARETVGAEAGDAVQRAARASRQVTANLSR